MGVTETQHQNQLVWIVQIWPIFALRRVDSARPRAQLCFVLLVSCYSLLQHSRPAWLERFVDHTHTHLMNDQRWQPHWLRRMTSFPRKSRDCEPETAFSASLKKRKSIINQDKLLLFFFFFFPLNLRLPKCPTYSTVVNALWDLVLVANKQPEQLPKLTSGLQDKPWRHSDGTDKHCQAFVAVVVVRLSALYTKWHRNGYGINVLSKSMTITVWR